MHMGCRGQSTEISFATGCDAMTSVSEAVRPACPARRILSEWRIDLVELDASYPAVLNVDGDVRAEIEGGLEGRVERVRKALQDKLHGSVQVQVAAGVAGLVQDYAELDWRFVGQSTWAYQCVVDTKGVRGPWTLEVPRVDGGECAIYVDERLVATTCNSHHAHTISLPDDCVAHAPSCVKLVIRSTVEVAKERVAEGYPTTDVMDANGPPPWGVFVNEAPHRNVVRMPACHHGWDWGPCSLPIGLTADVELWGYDYSPGVKYVPRIVDVPHAVDDAAIRIGFADAYYPHPQVDCEGIRHQQHSVASVLLQLGEIDTSKIIFSTSVCANGEQLVKLPGWLRNTLVCWSPTNPKLYRVRVLTSDEEDAIVLCERPIGFRTVDLMRKRTLTVSDEQQVEESFGFELNGVPTFIRGADIIPIDAYTSRCTPTEHARVAHWAKSINCNCIRLWGGGEAPNAALLAAADQAGVMVQVDLGFACALYPGDASFMQAVEMEASRWLSVIRRHPCVILMCGNNENEQWLEGEVAKCVSERRRTSLQRDYRVLTGVLSRVAARMAPNIPWWPSSPSNGPDEDGSCHDERRGNVHYWSVWHGGAPFSAFDDAHPRFVSEFGFQSFAAPTSLRRAASKPLHTADDPLMRYWQRSPEKGNAQIAHHIVANFAVADTTLQGARARARGEDGRVAPTGAECADLLCAKVEHVAVWSQASQALALERAVTAWRAAANDNRGIVVWQLQDLAPYHSWSLIDYFQQPKAAAYAVARAFAPRTLLLRVDGSLIALVDDVKSDELDDSESLHSFRLRIRFQVKSLDSRVLHEGDISCPSVAVSRPMDVGKLDDGVLSQCHGVVVVDYDMAVGRCVAKPPENPFARRVSVFTNDNGSPRGAFPSLALTPCDAGLSVQQVDGDEWSFDVLARKAAAFVTIRVVPTDGDKSVSIGRFSDGAMVMLAGERRRLRYLPVVPNTFGNPPKLKDLTIECAA